MSSTNLFPYTTLFRSYYERFASEPGVSTILGDAINADPTFFMLWIGSNDILRYITSGGTNPDHLTDPADFQRDYRQVIESQIGRASCRSGGRKSESCDAGTQ